MTTKATNHAHERRKSTQSRCSHSSILPCSGLPFRPEEVWTRMSGRRSPPHPPRTYKRLLNRTGRACRTRSSLRRESSSLASSSALALSSRRPSSFRPYMRLFAWKARVACHDGIKHPRRREHFRTAREDGAVTYISCFKQGNGRQMGSTYNRGLVGRNEEFTGPSFGVVHVHVAWGSLRGGRATVTSRSASVLPVCAVPISYMRPAHLILWTRLLGPLRAT